MQLVATRFWILLLLHMIDVSRSVLNYCFPFTQNLN